MQRIVQACPEVAAASQLRQLCSDVQAHVPDVEQSSIMVQWMMQEVADLGISGVSWTPAKVCDPKSTAKCVIDAWDSSCLFLSHESGTSWSVASS